MEATKLTLFVYTDDAEISDEARKLMTAAGYLPVRVKSLDSYRIVERTVRMSQAELDKVSAAALWAVQSDSLGGAQRVFLNRLGEMLGVWTFKK